MKDIEEVCDRILFLHAGRVLAAETSAEIKKRFAGKDLDDVFIKVARNEIEALHLWDQVHFGRKRTLTESGRPKKRSTVLYSQNAF